MPFIHQARNLATGIYGIGRKNESGERLVEFCKENNLVIGNTLFKEHPRRTFPWTSPDGQTRNQTDYILIQKRWKISMRYADDTTLLASTEERIRKSFKDLVQESAHYNMYINAKKSKTMVVSRQDNIAVQVDHEG